MYVCGVAVYVYMSGCVCVWSGCVCIHEWLCMCVERVCMCVKCVCCVSPLNYLLTVTSTSCKWIGF